MTTDKELLELAAIASAIKIDKSPYNGGGHGNTGFDMNGDAVLDWHNNKTWNPLTDDGDALRLAVKLQIIFGKYDDYANAAPLGENDIDIVVWSHQEKDPYAATRRAITRAAAEIGRAL